MCVKQLYIPHLEVRLYFTAVIGGSEFQSLESIHPCHITA